jgi:hypothetical protein
MFLPKSTLKLPNRSIALISADVLDSNGRLVERIPERVANTFAINWIKMLYTALSSVTQTSSLTDTGGTTTRTVSLTSNYMIMNAAAGAYQYGIVIGTGSGSAAYTYTALITQYTTTTNFTHSIMSFSLNSTGGAYQLLIQRTFSNSTGSTVSITEAGMYCAYGGTPFYFCLDHTMITISLASSHHTVLTYTIQVP